MAERNNSAPDTLTFEDAAPDTLQFEDAAPETLSFEDAGDGGAQRGASSPTPAGALPTQVTPAGAALDFVSRPGTASGMARGYLERAAQHTGEGMTAAHDSMGERVRRAATPGPAPWEDFGGYAGNQAQKMLDVPMMGMDALSFITRPFFGPVEQGISDVTGGVVSPDAAGTALMGLGPKGGLAKPMPKAAAPPAKPAPIAASEPVAAPKPPAVGQPTPPIAASAPAEITSYSPSATKGQIAVLDRKISRAEEALEAFRTEPSGDRTIETNLRDKLAQWTTERDALSGMALEAPGAEVVVTPAAKSKKGKAKAPTANDMLTNMRVDAYMKDRTVALRALPREIREAPELAALERRREAISKLGGIVSDESRVRLGSEDRRTTIASTQDVADAQKAIDDWVISKIRVLPGEKTRAPKKKAATLGDPIVAPETLKFEEAVPVQPPGASPLPSPAPPAPPSGGPPGAPPSGGGIAAPPGGGQMPPGGPSVPFQGPATNPRPLPPTLVEVAKWAPNKIHQILSPTTIDEFSRLGEAVFREKRGLALRETEKARAALDEFNGVVRTMDQNAQLTFIDYMETRNAPSGARSQIPREMQGLADAQRSLFQDVRSELEALPSTERMRYIEDYFPHFWDDPTAAADFMRAYGVGKEGGTGFTKGREIPTIADGLNAGLRLKSTNPVDATMQYVENAYKFIAQEKAFQVFRDLEYAKLYTPGKQPDGWSPLTGRKGAQQTPYGPKTYYAPDALARIYNNAISRDLEGPWGDVVHAAQRGSSFVTSLELSASGFHFATMAQEAVANGFANAALNAFTGHPVLATQQALKAFTNPVTYALTGGKVQRKYTGKPSTGPIQKAGDAIGPKGATLDKITDLLTRAGGRAVHTENVYLNSALNDYVSAWKKGTLKTELLADYKDVKGRPITGTASVVARHLARTMDTIMKPLFQVYIPKMKTGAFADNMGQWLKRNPNATPGDQLAAAREIWDSIDNRFGEMVRDNIFWKQAHKQAAQVALRSYTWTFGAGREIAGGIWDTAKLPHKLTQAAGKKLTGQPKAPAPGQTQPKQAQRRAFKDYLGTKSKDDPKLTQRMAYILGLPTAYVLGNIILQKLYTGENPQGVQDLLAARTGGKDFDTGRPERVVTPGFMKDVFGWYFKGVTGELYAKMATAPRTAFELAVNKDWRGMPVYPTGGERNAPSWAKAVFDHVADNLGPFGIKQVIRGKERGSEINDFMSLTGFQPTGMALTDPGRYNRIKERRHDKDWRRKSRADRKEESRYLGPD